jgi:hypothetical protein
MPAGEPKAKVAPVNGDNCNRAESGVCLGAAQASRDRKLARPYARKNISFASSLTTLVLALATSLMAQPTPTPGASDKNVTAEQVNEANIQLMRQDIRAERKKIVAANMPLTETEATKFWPLYDRYIGETTKINDARYALLKEYAQSYSNMTDEQADSLIKRWVALDGDTTQLRLKYIPQFENVISHKKTALFFQIDRRLSMMIDLQLASQVPLVKP